MSFLYPLVFWIGLPVIAAPAIIHLLNLRRQRKVPWAAMKFLLESKEQSKTWVNLRELLLLLLRTAAIALLVVMLAQPTTRSGWLGRLVNRPVHHLVVLDDSYSMADQWASTSAWREGISGVQQILRAAAEQSSASVATVLRHSEAQQPSDDPRPGIFRRLLDTAGLEELSSQIESSQPTQEAPTLDAALRRAIEIAELQSQDQDLVVHLVGDFRSRDLNASDEIEALVKRLAELSKEVRFVRCVRQMHENLAITALEPESGVRAADVEMWVRLELINYGARSASDVVVELHQDGNPLVAVPLGDVPPGETAERRFRVTFSDAGPHWLKASIEADAIDIDNQRYFATTLPVAQKVLMVDASANSWESYYLSTAVNPGGATRSGWTPEVVKPSELASIKALNDYSIVALLDVPRLTPEDLARLEAFVAEGGGLYVVLGESIDRGFYAKDGFREGKGLIPAPPALPTQWLHRAGSDTTQSDIQVSEHPLFRIFRGERNSMLNLMRVNYYYALATDWRSQAAEETRVLATLGPNTPLFLEKSIGEGKVILQLTKISPNRETLGSWSNLGANPAFVVLANDMFGYLASPQGVDQVVEAGGATNLRLSSRTHAASGSVRSIEASAPYQANLSVVSNGEVMELRTPRFPQVGLYSLAIDRVGGGADTRFTAVNPSLGEGDLQLATDTALRQKFAHDNLLLFYADQLSAEAVTSDSRWTEVLLGLLVLLLVVEQGLAFAASYHE